MTATVRASCVYGPEDTFAGGTTQWFRFPTAVTLSVNPSNNMSYLTPIGSKFFEEGVAGKFSGSGNVKFKLDYNLIEPLMLFCDTYEYDSGSGTHTFYISNAKRMKSFSLRYKKLNRMVGGASDETTTLVGCYATSFQVSQSSNAATLDCTIQFSYVNQSTSLSNLDGTDWDDYYANNPAMPIEWTCLFVGEESVAGTESSGFSISNGAGSVAGCGSRFDANYYVGQTQVTVNTTVYSNNPQRYLTLMYSGGYDGDALSPRTKGLRPIPEVSLRSSETADSDDYSMTVTFEDVYVNSGGATSFSDSKITESPSMRARNFTIEIKNTKGRITAWD